MKKNVVLCSILLLVSYNCLYSNEIITHPLQESEPIVKNEIVPSTWLPNFEDVNFNVRNIYAEADFSVTVPILFADDRLTNIGFSPKIEVGYNWDGWLLGLRYSFDTSVNGKSDLTRDIDIYSNLITFQLAKLIDKSLISFLPKNLQLKPTLGLGVNIISGSYEYKENDCNHSVSGGIFTFNAGLAVELVNIPSISKYVTPSLGTNFDFSPDENGLAFIPGFYIGVRTDLNAFLK